MEKGNTKNAINEKLRGVSSTIDNKYLGMFSPNLYTEEHDSVTIM